jgi:hypothetical protein
MALLNPRFTRPLLAEVEGRTDRSYTAWLSDRDVWDAALPATLPIGSVETSGIYVQGFNTFQLWLNMSGPGQVTVGYGICHPAEPWPVLAYRQLFGPVATGPSMLTSFGSAGQAAVAFQGDLYTAITLRIVVSGAPVQLKAAVFWCGLR